MELDDLKHIWNEANSASPGQPGLNQQTIEKMTRIRFRSRLRKVIFHETLGTLMSFGAVAYIIFHFGKLSTPFYQWIGVITAVLLAVLPVISLILLWQINSTGDFRRPLPETLREFATQKLRFYRFQQASVVAGYVLVVFVILLMPRFTNGRSLNENKYFWAGAIAVGYVFLYFFSRWVLKSYNYALQQAEELLKELEG